MRKQQNALSTFSTLPTRDLGIRPCWKPNLKDLIFSEVSQSIILPISHYTPPPIPSITRCRSEHTIRKIKNTL